MKYTRLSVRSQARLLFGRGVIWNIIPSETPVIPAKAGIQSVNSAFPKVCGVDSRFRGNDCGLEPPCLANDTTSSFLVVGQFDAMAAIPQGGIAKWRRKAASASM
jgi:hypothetical protein